MTRDELFAALDRHGGDLARWPADERRAAESADRTDPAFRAALAEARELDALMDQALQVPETPFGYGTRIAARAREANETGRAFRLPRWIYALGTGWAMASIVAGFAYADILTTTDTDVLALADLALGSISLVTGN
jgi:hypothetical protein